jgi:hypothetical protein
MRASLRLCKLVEVSKAGFAGKFTPPEDAPTRTCSKPDFAGDNYLANSDGYRSD